MRLWEDLSSFCPQPQCCRHAPTTIRQRFSPPIPHYKVSSIIENKQQLVHFNWGWGGECDGYFAAGESVKTTEGVRYDSNASITHNMYFLQENISLRGGIHN
ncbi:MAG: C10 family peptidase [Alistipes sp.]|nr:C10 family peptidase [Alistipes sp.]